MARVGYFYALTPVAIVLAAAVILTIPYLALVVLMAVVILVVGALGWAVVRVLRALGHAVGRRWPGAGVSTRQATVAAPALQPARSMPTVATAFLGSPPPGEDR
jgi:hypothetical protein